MTADPLDAFKGRRDHLERLPVDLRRIGFQLHREPYDRVLRDKGCEEKPFEDLVEYVARNPERAGLVPIDGLANKKARQGPLKASSFSLSRLKSLHRGFARRFQHSRRLWQRIFDHNRLAEADRSARRAA